jgi:hypothetical protein
MRSKMMRMCIVFVAVYTFCGCGPQAIVEDVKSKVFGGAPNFELLRSAPTVKACRLNHEEVGERLVEFAEYKEGEFVATSSTQADRFRAILVDPSTYLLDAKKTCGNPIYGVRVRFEASDGVLDVNLCFKCSDLETTRDGMSLGQADFHRGRGKILQLCKELFPNDAEIQQLKPR